MRRLLLLLVVFAIISLVILFLSASPFSGVHVTFKGIERIYAERGFMDAVLLSFVNDSKVDVKIVGWKFASAPGRFEHMKTVCYAHDDTTTNPIVFRGVQGMVLKPGQLESIAVPARHGITNSQVELDYAYEGVRNKFALWLGPARGGNLVPSLLRRVKTERFESERLPFVPEEPSVVHSGQEVGMSFSPMRSGVLSTRQRMVSTNALVPSRPR
jgi:hypothetical protein